MPLGGINSFTLKVIAIIGMTSNHFAHLFSAQLSFELTCFLYSLGGLAFPIMAFLVSEGYRFTSNLKKYALRLLLFALVSQIPYWLFLGPEGNVLFTLLLGISVMYLYDTLANRVVFWALFVLALLMGLVLDWGTLGVLMIFLFHTLKGKHERIIIPIVLVILGLGLPQLGSFVSTQDVQHLPPVLYVFAGCSLTIPLLLFYNSERGMPLKYFFYAYYPAHILVLGLIKGIVIGEW